MRAVMVRDAHGFAAALPWFEAALAADPNYRDGWAEYAATLGDAGEAGAMLEAIQTSLHAEATARRDAWPASGGPPGSDVDFMREQLLDALGVASDAGYERSIDSHIKSVRAKLRLVAANAEPIQTHRGLGYSYSPSNS